MFFCIAQIGECVTHFTNDFRDQFKDVIPWQQIIGMRHKIIHGYVTIEISKVWDTAVDDIPKLYKFCVDKLKETQTPKTKRNKSPSPSSSNPSRFKP
jgi:uncharacterized protein with HEPN domain